MAECYINDLVVPEEQDNVRRIWKTEIPRFFEEGMLKQSWKYRLKDEHRSEEWYELTLLRVDIEHPRRRKALLLWRHMEPLQPEADSDENRLREDRRVLHNILKGILRCRNDRWFTMIDVDEGFLGYTRQEIKQRFNDCYIE